MTNRALARVHTPTIRRGGVLRIGTHGPHPQPHRDTAEVLIINSVLFGCSLFIVCNASINCAARACVLCICIHISIQWMRIKCEWFSGQKRKYSPLTAPMTAPQYHLHADREEYSEPEYHVSCVHSNIKWFRARHRAQLILALEFHTFARRRGRGLDRVWVRAVCVWTRVMRLFMVIRARFVELNCVQITLCAIERCTSIT